MASRRGLHHENISHDAQKELIPVSVEKMGRKIYGVHVADNASMTNAHNKIGDGTIDWEATLKALKKFNFTGYFAIDIQPRNVKNIKQDYIESKLYLEKLGKKIGL